MLMECEALKTENPFFSPESQDTVPIRSSSLCGTLGMLPKAAGRGSCYGSAWGQSGLTDTAGGVGMRSTLGLQSQVRSVWFLGNIPIGPYTELHHGHSGYSSELGEIEVKLKGLSTKRSSDL